MSSPISRPLALLLASPALALAQTTPESWSLPRVQVVTVASDGSRHVRDELLVVLDTPSARPALEELVRERGGFVAGEVAVLGVLRIAFDDGRDARTELGRFAALPGVTHAELNALGTGGGAPAPNDTCFGAQWHLENTGQSGTPGADVEARGAWAIQTGDAAVVLAILDTGIDFANPDFAGRTLPGFDFVNSDADPTADHPHGILVAGLAAANTDNSFAAAGVDRACTILPVKVLNSNNSGSTFNLVQGIDFARTSGAEVVCMSLINFPPSGSLATALSAARSAGLLLMACAGNGGIGDADLSWPGASPDTIAIGATTSSDARASFSGTGSALDFVAPGAGVRTVNPSGGDSCSLFTGCSAATPIAAGIVTLLVAQHPGLTQDEAYCALQSGAEDQVGPGAEDTLGRDDFFGHGRLNARVSLEQLATCTGAPTTYCQGKINSSFCLPFMSHTGLPSVSSSAPFQVRGNDVMPDEFGILLYGIGGSANLTFHNGTLCVKAPLVRVLPPKNSGSPGAGFCPGELRRNFNATIQSGNDPALTAGREVYCQWIYRDPGVDSFNDGLTDGVRFTIGS